MVERISYLGGEFLEDEDNVDILRYVLCIFNTVFFIGAAIVFAVGMYITFDSSMGDYTEGLSLGFYLNGVAVLMAAASLVILNSFLGCCSAFFLSRRALLLHMLVTVMTFIMLLAASAFILSNGLEQSKLYPYIQETMRGMIYQYQWDMPSKRSVDIIQEYVGCCGGYGANDYIDIHMAIPDTCRNQVTGNQYGDSCAEVMSWLIEKRTGWICGISLCLCFLEIFSLVVSTYIILYVNRIRRKL